MNRSAFKIIMLWLLAETLIWIPFHNLIGYNNLFIAIVYFFSFVLITLVLFRDIFVKVIADMKIKSYLLLLASLTIHAVTYYICHTFLNEPTEIIKSSPASYVLVNSYFLWSKPIDILMQQLMLFVLVTKLYKNKISLKNITLAVAIIFGAAHIDSLQRMGLAYALILTVSATLMSLLLPYFVLRKKEGLVCNLMLHLGFIDIAALLFWSVLQ